MIKILRVVQLKHIKKVKILDGDNKITIDFSKNITKINNNPFDTFSKTVINGIPNKYIHLEKLFNNEDRENMLNIVYDMIVKGCYSISNDYIYIDYNGNEYRINTRNKDSFIIGRIGDNELVTRFYYEVNNIKSNTVYEVLSNC
jgi:hypothetical protein|nr:MAG TPA: hypothetical protein [Caudoviricetes sp.]